MGIDILEVDIIAKWAPNVVRVATLWHGYNKIDKSQHFEMILSNVNSSHCLQRGRKVTTLPKILRKNKSSIMYKLQGIPFKNSKDCKIL